MQIKFFCVYPFFEYVKNCFLAQFFKGWEPHPLFHGCLKLGWKFWLPPPEYLVKKLNFLTYSEKNNLICRALFDFFSLQISWFHHIIINSNIFGAFSWQHYCYFCHFWRGQLWFSIKTVAII